MKSTDPAPARAFDRNAFLILLAVLTVALAAIIWPFYGAVFWGAVLALLFEPLYRKLAARLRNRRTVAALVTLSVILVMVILPLTLVAISLVQEVTAMYQRVRSGQVNFGAYFAQILAALPSWASGLLERLGLDDLAVLQTKLTAAINQRGETFASRAVNFGQDALDLVIGFCIAMYLLFFLLRDGAAVAREIRAAIPLDPIVKARLPRALHDRDPRDRQGQRPGRRRAGRARRPRVLGPRRSCADAVGGRDGFPVAAAGRRRGADLGPGRDLPARRRPARPGLRPDRLRRLRDRPDRQRAAADPGRQGHPDA
jgi:hypothetical protein